MASMKANIETAAELLSVPVEDLTEYLLDRDPDLASCEEDQRDRVVQASIMLGIEPTLLLLAVLDITRGQRTADPERALDEIRAVIVSPSAQPHVNTISAMLSETGRAV